MPDWTEFRKVSLWVTLVAAIISFLAWRFPVSPVDQGKTQPSDVVIKLEPSPQTFPVIPASSIPPESENNTSDDSVEESKRHVWMTWGAPWAKSKR